MAKAVKGQHEIEALLLSELRKVEGCEGAAGVSIYPLADERDEVTWSVQYLNPGTSGVDRCQNVMAEIAARLQRLYDLAPGGRT
jgi:hypothetical protein